MLKEFSVSSRKKIELIDITAKVERIVKESGLKEGVVVVFIPHATAGLVLNEHESGLINDFEKWFEKSFRGDWEHDRIDDNASAHLASGLIGSSVHLILSEGRILRGVWQNLFLVELDGPRKERKVLVKLIRS